MNVASWLVLGLAATLVMTTFMTAMQGLRFTRIDLPFILGTFLTPDRERAKLVGFAVHLVAGLVFSVLYVAIFEQVRLATWWFGALLGLAHASFVLTVGMHLLPGLHPRMATEQQGPTMARQLEPPGLLALNYGVATPITVVLAHLVFGAILGGMYRS